MTKAQIDQKYIDQANQLEAEFFNIVDEGLPNQHRVLKAGKTIEDFNLQHGDIWKAHEAELIAEGFMEPSLEPEPPRSTYFARITGFDVAATKSLTVVRTWQGNDYTYDCFVTQDIVDAYQAGKLAVGDYVLIHFDDEGRQIAMMKVYKTW